MGETRSIAATVRGRVQGVGFRYSTQRIAQQLGLDGWVRNRHDGAVELLAQGHPDVIDRFVAFLEEGPPAARVTSVDLREVTADQTINGFRVRS